MFVCLRVFLELICICTTLIASAWVTIYFMGIRYIFSDLTTCTVHFCLVCYTSYNSVSYSLLADLETIAMAAIGLSEILFDTSVN